jgi:predicted dithiol-disulfide oxidoreductase (DUF899 family)
MTGWAQSNRRPLNPDNTMAKLITWNGTKEHAVVAPKQWLAARKALLVEEKKFMRLHDRLKERRRALPWTRVEKDYVFDGPRGPETLAQLFAGQRQLIVYHFMFPPEDSAGCEHCSFWADHFDSARRHLPARDTTLVVISRASRKKIARFQHRMGWKFKWLSSGKNTFNYDFGVSFTPADIRSGRAIYNYAKLDMDINDREGVSTFYQDQSGAVFHTYSSFARGIDLLNTTYNFLDLTAKGRDENPEMAQAWVRYHDKYGARS